MDSPRTTLALQGQFTSNTAFDWCNHDVVRLAINSCLTHEQCLKLSQEVTVEEIKAMMFSLARNKAPSRDGYPVEFFDHAWEEIRSHVAKAIHDFFRTRKLLREVNNTIIALVPKVVNPSSLLDYRPILCCNTIYMCIAKVMANRIAPLLPDLIGREQSVFVLGRRIANII